MNIENLNKLIAHLELLPPESINMSDMSPDANCGCILRHASNLFPDQGDTAYDTNDEIDMDLYTPPDFFEERDGVRRYPAHRVIATLKRLRDTYLATGQVVVDWGPEPDAGKPWVAPQVAEVIAPALPPEITGLLRPSLTKTEV